jgi:hypothetical protein
VTIKEFNNQSNNLKMSDNLNCNFYLDIHGAYLLADIGVYAPTLVILEFPTAITSRANAYFN